MNQFYHAANKAALDRISPSVNQRYPRWFIKLAVALIVQFVRAELFITRVIPRWFCGDLWSIDRNPLISALNPNDPTQWGIYHPWRWHEWTYGMTHEQAAREVFRRNRNPRSEDPGLSNVTP